MGCVRSFKVSSVISKIVLFVMMASAALTWTSFVTAGWGNGYVLKLHANFTGYGLWRSCGDSEISPHCLNLLGWNLHWYRAVQAFAVLGFTSVNLCLLFILLLIFVPECQKGKSLILWLSVLGFWAAVCYIVAIVVFAASFHSQPMYESTTLAYGWGIAIAVAILQTIVGVLIIFEARRADAKAMDL